MTPQPLKTWNDLNFWKTPTWRNIYKGLKSAEAVGIYHSPPLDTTLTPLLLTPPRQVRVVILGDYPYLPPMSHGIPFSCPQKVQYCPETLQTILNEYSTDLKKPLPRSGNLIAWTKRGVLMLNNTWTCLEDRQDAHAYLGWSDLTKEILERVHATNPETVFILWGPTAFVAAAHIRGIKRVISGHPRGSTSTEIPFAGSRPFTRTNALLVNAGLAPIDWSLPENKKRT